MIMLVYLKIISLSNLTIVKGKVERSIRDRYV